MLSFFKKIRAYFHQSPIEDARAVIIIGTEYTSYSVSAALNESGKYQVIAFIDEEPWHHRTKMHDALVYYPDELLALVEKHSENHTIAAVISFQGEGWEMSLECLDQLKELNTRYCQVPKAIESTAAKLGFILDRV